MRSEHTLKSFIKYCEEHPQERFWQALRNWSGYAFVYAANREVVHENLQDTFYWRGQHKHE